MTFTLDTDEGGMSLRVEVDPEWYDPEDGAFVYIPLDYTTALELVEVLRPVREWLAEAESARASYIPASQIRDELDSGVYDHDAGKHVAMERELERRGDG
jgi:hypothetical protein